MPEPSVIVTTTACPGTSQDCAHASELGDDRSRTRRHRGGGGLLHRLRQQYGDREWTEREVLMVLDQIVGKSSRLNLAIKSIGL